MKQQLKSSIQVKKFSVIIGITRKAWKVGIYGPEGVGKSSLAALCPEAKFADIEDSMHDLNCPKVQGISGWLDLLDWVESLGKGDIGGIDSVTRAEDWAAAYVIKHKSSNDGTKATDSLEDFKYKAGLRFVNDEFKKLLFRIDTACRRGASFIMVAHNRINNVVDPDGKNYVRSEPNLVDTKEVSNMRQWVQFLDHCAFIDLDKTVERSKVQTSGSRTIYLDTSASHISKCRGISSKQIDYPEGDTELWERLGVIK